MGEMHLSTDIETLGTVPGSVILSIGAVAFDPVTGAIETPFYRNLLVEPQTAVGASIDDRTVQWWAGQSDAARERLNHQKTHPQPALEALADYWKRHDCRFVWGHGAGFDVTLLESLHRAFSVPVRWRFQDVRDTRTLFDVAGVGVRREKGLHHDAADDAVNQAEAVIRAYRALGLSGGAVRRWVGRRLRQEAGRG
jgi:hypothetical protein